jgi:hypothetical protein
MRWCEYLIRVRTVVDGRGGHLGCARAGQARRETESILIQEENKGQGAKQLDESDDRCAKHCMVGRDGRMEREGDSCE